jgi:hypothetical protein
MMKCERSNDSLVGSRRNGLNSGLHQAADEVDVPGKAIQFGDDEGGAMQPAEPEGLGDRWAVVPLAALHLYDLLHQSPLPTVEVAGDCLPLCLKAKAADSLPLGRNSEITHEFAVSHGFTFQDICFNAR